MYNNALACFGISDNTGLVGGYAEDIANVLKISTSLISYAHKKITGNKKDYKEENIYKPRAISASLGSFNVHLLCTEKVDIHNYSKLEPSLGLIQKLLSKSSTNQDLEEYIEVLKKYKGHTVSQLRNLVNLIVRNDLTLKYKWYSPSSKKISSSTLNTHSANLIIDILTDSEELAEEIKQFEGFFSKIDSPENKEEGAWRFKPVDGPPISGTSLKKFIDGLTINTISYKIECLEHIEEMIVSGKKNVSYTIKNITNRF